MSSTSETMTLNIKVDSVETKAYSKYRDYSYYIIIGNCTALRERCRAVAEAFGGNANVVESALVSLLDWMSNDDAYKGGKVYEDGWYEPPHFCYSDPAAACDSDGGITEAKVDTDNFDDLCETFVTAITEAIKGMDDDTDNDWVTAEEADTLRVCKHSIAAWLADEVLKFDGKDIHEE